MHYSPKTDALIYSAPTREFAPHDFMGLALAAADQAGLTPGDLFTIRAVFEAKGIFYPKHEVKFDLRLRRSRPYDHEVDVMVTAQVCFNGIEWEVIEAEGVNSEGGQVDGPSDQEQIEEAALDRARKLTP